MAMPAPYVTTEVTHQLGQHHSSSHDHQGLMIKRITPCGSHLMIQVLPHAGTRCVISIWYSKFSISEQDPALQDRP